MNPEVVSHDLARMMFAQTMQESAPHAERQRMVGRIAALSRMVEQRARMAIDPAQRALFVESMEIVNAKLADAIRAIGGEL